MMGRRAGLDTGGGLGPPPWQGSPSWWSWIGRAGLLRWSVRLIQDTCPQLTFLSVQNLYQVYG